jgi:hypothetical protein
MILTVDEFKTKYLRDKVNELFTVNETANGQNNTYIMSDDEIAYYLGEAETRVQIDTGFATLPVTEPVKYAIAMYAIANRVSSGIVKIHSESDTYINTYYSNYKNAVKKLRRKTHGWAALNEQTAV